MKAHAMVGWFFLLGLAALPAGCGGSETGTAGPTAAPPAASAVTAASAPAHDEHAGGHDAIAGAPAEASASLKQAYGKIDAAHHELAAIVEDGDLSKAHLVAERIAKLAADVPALGTKAALPPADVEALAAAAKELAALFEPMDEAGDGGKRDEAAKVLARYDAPLAVVKAKALLEK